MNTSLVRKTFVLIIVVMTVVATASAEDAFLNQSLRRGVGVRAMGMGGAFTGVADDATAAFYNPGGIKSIDFQYYVENSDYKNYTLDRADNYLLQYKNWVMTDWHNRDKNGRQVDVFAYSFGQEGPSGWGFTYKRVLSNFGTDGYTVDFGTLMNLGQTMKFGFLAQDLFKDNVDIRTALRAGLSMRLLDNKLLLAVDE
ncbi:MAG: hypothetical protein WC838_05380, partial [Candidatus Margulisiibacteriota bacterium]